MASSTTRTPPSSAPQQEGNSYGAAAEAFSEGPLVAPLPGPKTEWDTPHYAGDNDFDDSITERAIGYKAVTSGAAPQSVDQDTVGGVTP